jgi:hypothetical protein
LKATGIERGSLSAMDCYRQLLRESGKKATHFPQHGCFV